LNRKFSLYKPTTNQHPAQSGKRVVFENTGKRGFIGEGQKTTRQLAVTGRKKEKWIRISIYL